MSASAGSCRKLHKELESGAETITVRIEDDGTELELTHDFTDKEREVLLCGGLLEYLLATARPRPRRAAPPVRAPARSARSRSRSRASAAGPSEFRLSRSSREPARDVDDGRHQPGQAACSAAATRLRPRCSRLMIVPTGTPSSSAASA